MEQRLRVYQFPDEPDKECHPFYYVFDHPKHGLMVSYEMFVEQGKIDMFDIEDPDMPFVRYGKDMYYVPISEIRAVLEARHADIAKTLDWIENQVAGEKIKHGSAIH